MEQNHSLNIIPKQALAAVVFGAQDRIAAIHSLGSAIAKSGWFGCNSTEAGEVIAITCLEEGMTLTDFNRTYDLILNKPRKKAQAALVEFERSGGKFAWVQTGDERTANLDDQKAVILLERGGKKVTYEYSIRDAKQEGVFKKDSRYEKRPGNMLRARCCSNGIGIIAPEIYCGPDESNEVPAELNLGAAQVTATPPEPATEVKTIKVEFQTTPPADEKELAEKGLAPNPTKAAVVATSVATPPPASPAPVSSAPTAGRLSDETVSKVEAAIGVNAIKATDWLVKEKWLQPGQDLSYLTATRAERIIRNTASFIAAISNENITCNPQS